MRDGMSREFNGDPTERATRSARAENEGRARTLARSADKMHSRPRRSRPAYYEIYATPRALIRLRRARDSR